MITRVSVEEAVERVVGQSLKHLVNEGEREVIFPGCFVELPVIDAHPPSSHGPLRDEFIPLILDHGHSTLLWHHLNGANPFTVLHRVDDTRVQ